MMKKQRIFCWAFLGGSLLTGGCVSTVDEPAEDAAPISFATTATRAAVDADKNGMENFLVWGGFDSQNNLFNAEIVTKDGYYTGTRYWVADKAHDFYALHPVSLKENASCESGTITVIGFDTSIKRGTEALDLMTASATGITYQTGQIPAAVPLIFGHELSRVRFTIKTDADVHISNVRLTGIAYKGDFTTKPYADAPWSNLTTATETDTPFSQTEVFELGADGSRHLLAGIPDSNNENYGDLLLIPQSLSETAVFTMTWTYDEDGRSRTVNVPLPRAGAGVWERGKSYRYTATIPLSATDITLNVDVLDWNDRRVDADL